MDSKLECPICYHEVHANAMIAYKCGCRAICVECFSKFDQAQRSKCPMCNRGYQEVKKDELKALDSLPAVAEALHPSNAKLQHAFIDLTHTEQSLEGSNPQAGPGGPARGLDAVPAYRDEATNEPPIQLETARPDVASPCTPPGRRVQEKDPFPHMQKRPEPFDLLTVQPNSESTAADPFSLYQHIFSERPSNIPPLDWSTKQSLANGIGMPYIATKRKSVVIVAPGGSLNRPSDNSVCPFLRKSSDSAKQYPRPDVCSVFPNLPDDSPATFTFHALLAISGWRVRQVQRLNHYKKPTEVLDIVHVSHMDETSHPLMQALSWSVCANTFYHEVIELQTSPCPQMDRIRCLLPFPTVLGHVARRASRIIAQQQNVTTSIIDPGTATFHILSICSRDIVDNRAQMDAAFRQVTTACIAYVDLWNGFIAANVHIPSIPGGLVDNTWGQFLEPSHLPADCTPAAYFVDSDSVKEPHDLPLDKHPSLGDFN